MQPRVTYLARDHWQLRALLVHDSKETVEGGGGELGVGELLLDEGPG